MDKPLLLDLFSGAGGAARSYAEAGFEVVGVDMVAQPHYPYVFRQGDALACLDALLAGCEWGGYILSDFATIHASPPCQDYSSGGRWVVPGRVRRKSYPRLIVPVRERLVESRKPWVLENVRLAMSEMLHPVMLCGTSFGLRVQRHRLFDASIHLFAAGPCRHRRGDVSVRRHRIEYLGMYTPHLLRDGRVVDRKPYCSIAEGRVAMGIDWMTMTELGEAIPPAYTSWIGRQLMAVIQTQGPAA